MRLRDVTKRPAFIARCEKRCRAVPKVGKHKLVRDYDDKEFYDEIFIISSNAVRIQRPS